MGSRYNVKVPNEILKDWNLALHLSDEDNIKKQWRHVNYKIMFMFILNSREIAFLNRYDIYSGKDDEYNNCTCCNSYKDDYFMYVKGKDKLCYFCYFK